MTDVGFEFHIPIRGSYYLTESPLTSYSMVADLKFCAKSITRFMHEKAFLVEGALYADKLSDGNPLNGEFIVKTFRNRRFTCDLMFQSNNKTNIRLYGEQDLIPTALVDSLSTIAAMLYTANGTEIGRADLRLDLRKGWTPILKSLRPKVER